MRRTGTARPSLFLMELVVALLFFALAAAVCLRLFLAAWRISEDSQALSQATLLTQSAAECFKAAGGDLQGTAELFGAPVSEDVVTTFYDGSWRPSVAWKAKYILTVRRTGEQGRLISGLVDVRGQGGVPVFSLEVSAWREEP